MEATSEPNADARRASGQRPLAPASRALHRRQASEHDLARMAARAGEAVASVPKLAVPKSPRPAPSAPLDSPSARGSPRADALTRAADAALKRSAAGGDGSGSDGGGNGGYSSGLAADCVDPSRPAPAYAPAGAAAAPMTSSEAERVHVYTSRERWPEAHDHVVRVALIGDAGVGKSTLSHSFVGSRHDKAPTIGVDMLVRPVRFAPSGRVALVEITDTAGQERFAPVVGSCIKGAHVVLVVYDVCSRASFDSIPRRLAEVERYWRDAAPIVSLVGNKRDCLGSSRLRQVEPGVASALAEERGFYFFETSALTGQAVRTAFLTLVEAAVERLRRTAPDPPPPRLQIVAPPGSPLTLPKEAVVVAEANDERAIAERAARRAERRAEARAVETTWWCSLY